MFKIKPLISIFKIFGCPCFILSLKDSISKFAAKVDCGYFLGYSSTAKAYKVFNTRTRTIEETLNVKFNELSSLKIPANPAELFDLDKFKFEDITVKTNNAGTPQSPQQDYRTDVVIPSHYKVYSASEEAAVQNNCQNSVTAESTTVGQSYPQTTASPLTTTAQSSVDKSQTSVDKSQSSYTPLGPIPPLPFQTSDGTTEVQTDVTTTESPNLCPSPQNAIIPYQGDLIYLRAHPPDQIIGNIREGVLTRSQSSNIYLFAGFLSLTQPVKYQEALKDNSWVEAMQEELLQFKR